MVFLEFSETETDLIIDLNTSTFGLFVMYFALKSMIQFRFDTVIVYLF